MYSVVDHNRSQKFKALNKLCIEANNKEYWSAFMQSIFHIPLNVLPKLNVKPGDTKSLLIRGCHIHQFWKQILDEWLRFHFKKPEKCTGDELLLCNSAIPSRTVFRVKLMLNLQKRGIYTIHDFITKCNASSVTLFNLKTAIDSVFDVTQFVCPTPSCDLTVPITTSAIRKYLGTFNTFKPHNTWVKWARDTLCLSIVQDWHRICGLRTSFIHVKMQAFHWKFINRAICTNVHLFAMGRARMPTCSFCKEEDKTFIHLFWDCPRVADLWRKVIRWCKMYITENFEYDIVNCYCWDRLKASH